MSPQALINGESMAVPEQIPYTEYVANGVTKAFALTFNCQSKDHLMVFFNEIAVLQTDFSLTLSSQSESVSFVTFNTAPQIGTRVQLQRNTPLSRSTHYQSYNNSLRPSALNIDFDRLWLAMQEQRFKSTQIEQKIDNLINIFNNFSLLQQASSLTGNELMLVNQEEQARTVTVNQLLNYLSDKLPPSVIEKPTLSIAALLNQQQIIGNTAPQAQITATIDDSLTVKVRADGLEIKGKAQPNSTIIVEY